ncbi:MAG: DUF2934 domain-containing protein [Candidatus Acidiferrum sp.]|jgi:hypothetical protein
MSTPAKGLDSAFQRNVAILTAAQEDEFASKFRQRVQDRAYQLYERQGSVDGQSDSHWLQAERELLQHAPPVHESGAWSTANLPLQDADTQNIQVLVFENRATVALANPPAYFLIRWPNRVDPATAAAYMKGNTLVVTAKHTSASGGAAAAEVPLKTN